VIAGAAVAAAAVLVVIVVVGVVIGVLWCWKKRKQPGDSEQGHRDGPSTTTHPQPQVQLDNYSVDSKLDPPRGEGVHEGGANMHKSSADPGGGSSDSKSPYSEKPNQAKNCPSTHPLSRRESVDGSNNRKADTKSDPVLNKLNKIDGKLDQVLRNQDNISKSITLSPKFHSDILILFLQRITRAVKG